MQGHVGSCRERFLVMHNFMTGKDHCSNPNPHPNPNAYPNPITLTLAEGCCKGCIV